MHTSSKAVNCIISWLHLTCEQSFHSWVHELRTVEQGGCCCCTTSSLSHIKGKLWRNEILIPSVSDLLKMCGIHKACLLPLPSSIKFLVFSPLTSSFVYNSLIKVKQNLTKKVLSLSLRYYLKLFFSLIHRK